MLAQIRGYRAITASRGLYPRHIEGVSVMALLAKEHDELELLPGGQKSAYITIAGLDH